VGPFISVAYLAWLEAKACHSDISEKQAIDAITNGTSVFLERMKEPWQKELDGMEPTATVLPRLKLLAKWGTSGSNGQVGDNNGRDASRCSCGGLSPFACDNGHTFVA
jgi:hypothetical protein